MNKSFSELQGSIIQRKKELLKEKLLTEEQSPFFNSQYNNILKQIAYKVSEFSISKKENEDDFENRLYDAFEIVDDIKLSIKSPKKSIIEEEAGEKDLKGKKIKDEDHVVWFHGDIQRAFEEGYESEHSKKSIKTILQSKQ